jgi:glutathione-regulated potassium-efflux system protein KefB
MNHASGDFGLLLALVLLAAAVVSVPIARSLRLSAIVAYLAAGVVIGPFGLGLVTEPETIVAVAELGVVLLLFLVGLELELSRLLTLRGAILGLGTAQLALTAAVIGGLGFATGMLGWRGAVVAGLALAMSATSIALKILEDRGHLQQLYGQRAFAILLFQDMSVVPLLALLPLLAPGMDAHTGSLADALVSVGKIALAIAAVVLAGRCLLNPFLRLLASTGAREIMTAAALLVVLGAAALMQVVGMSMALGAFLAGVVLAESNYRHELEADIEPFRGLLLALFFMGVGMSVDVGVVREHLMLILIAALAITALKAMVVALIFRTTCPRVADALRAGSVLTSAGEFAFVLIPLGVGLSLLTPGQGSLLAAIAAVTMLLGPPVASLTDVVLERLAARTEPAPDDFDDARGSVLVIGFGRFGQIASQCLIAEGLSVTAIDNDAEMIASATSFGFRVYYGDGTRLDVLRAARADDVRLIAICIDDPEAANFIVDLVKGEFPGTKLYVRSFDRRHTLNLIDKGVDYEMRETFESALTFGGKMLEALGFDPDRAGAVTEFVRQRDRDRLALQEAEGIAAGVDLLRTRMVHEPLSEPRRRAEALNAEAEEIMEHDEEEKAET